MPITHCPHLGLAEDPTLHLSYPDERHRCFASSEAAEVEPQHQERFCLTEEHAPCPRYVTPPQPVRHTPRPLQAEPDEGAGEEVAPSAPWWRPFLWGTALVLLALVVWRYGTILQNSGHPSPTALFDEFEVQSGAGETVTRDATGERRQGDWETRRQGDPLPLSPSPPLPVTPSPNPTDVPTSPAVALPTATPTPWPEGRIYTLNPAAGAVGWVASDETRGNHFGDSYIYSGVYDGVIFHGGMQFDLSRIAPGTRIHAAALHLTGLSDLRLGQGGTWEVRILSAAANEEWSRQTFQTLHNAVAEQTLLPVLGHDGLRVGGDNVFAFNEEQLRLLEERLLDGAIAFRLDGPQTAPDSVFAWDSGYGPASRGQGPVLWISAGPPPRTPLPTATIEYVVITHTPTPENVMTAAAVLQTATAQATLVGTPTPWPPHVATPTPTTAFLVVTPTPTPENAATATAISAYATAVALTTGTFTPTPLTVVTATPTPAWVMVTATPTPQSAVAALATAIAEATRLAREGTATPRPANWVVAVVVTATPTPENAATATAISARATIVALTQGTFTPTPFYMLTATPAPATPLLIYVDELTPTPTSTPTPPLSSFAIPPVLQGKIAFLSDRGGQAAVYVMEPDGRGVALLTSRWPYDVALQREPLSPDGHERVFVENDGQGIPQLFIFTPGQATPRQLTAGESMSYDPAWSPRDDLIAFVSQEPGNDEIFVIQSDGGGRKRLTVNEWEWDKHPTWSPDGTQIAFWSNRETGRQQIWIMNADGSEPRNISDNPYNDWAPVWIR